MTFSTLPDTSFVNNVDLHQAPSRDSDMPPQGSPPPRTASGEKAKARDILAAIRTLKAIEQEQRPATPEERQSSPASPASARWPCPSFPDPVTGRYKDAAWQELGEELQALLTPEEYASAKRTTFNAFYTSPTVMQAMHEALARLGVPADATVLEPGCGIGNFLSLGPGGHALHRRRAGPPLRPHRPRAAPRPRHPHRELPRHAPARGPHRRGDRQRAVRRPQARLPRAGASPCTTSSSPSPSTP